MTDQAKLTVRHIKTEITVTDLDSPAWENSEPVAVDTYWSGHDAPSGRHFTAGLLWSDTSLHVRFRLKQIEPLVVSPSPEISRKTIGLWDRDVGEIFIAPNPDRVDQYFEFEVAPTGEWVDLAVDVTGGDRRTDLEYDSGMGAAARIEEGRVLMAMKIPWEAFGRRPKTGDIWLGNIFRCVGREPDRGYLAWSPTMTGKPNFHVPERFGRLIFDD